MPFFKKKLTEREAASYFILNITKEAQDAWPVIYRNLRETGGENFTVKNEGIAVFDLSLAAIAQELPAIKNLFPKEQAERIVKWIFKFIDTKDWGKFAVDEIMKYDELFQEEVGNIKSGSDPLSAIPARLLYRWLGENIKNFEVEISGKKTGIISPVLVMTTIHSLSAFLGTWKRVKQNFKLIEDDLPPDENVHKLRDYKSGSEEIKPDGTIQFYDEDGNLCEKQVPIEQLKELLKKGGAKRVYKVLIKGPWDGIKEAYWELSAENVKQFVDEEGYAYAFCAYEKGQPIYFLTAKNLWKKESEVLEIQRDPNLSPQQKLEAIRRLANN